MSDSVYYKATDEDGNTVLKHSWKKHKYLYIKNGKYVYPEDVKKSSAPYKGPTWNCWIRLNFGESNYLVGSITLRKPYTNQMLLDEADIS
jgi:hypothetical protein